MNEASEMVGYESETELQPGLEPDDFQPGAPRESKAPELEPDDFQPGATQISKRQKKRMLKTEHPQQTSPVPEKTKEELKESKRVLATEKEHEKGKIAFKLGVELHCKGQNQEALKHMTLSFNSHYPPAFLFLNDVLQQEMKDVSQHKKALKQWCAKESKQSKNQDANTFYCLGLYSDLVANDKKLAVEWYKKAIALDPKYLEALYRLGNCYATGSPYLTKDPQAALKHYSEAAQQGYKPAETAAAKLNDELEKKAKDKIEEAKKKAEKEEKEKAKKAEKEKAKSESLEQAKLMSASVLHTSQSTTLPMEAGSSIPEKSLNLKDVKKVEVAKQGSELPKTSVATLNKKPEKKAKNPLSALFRGVGRSASSEVSIPVVESKLTPAEEAFFERAQKAYRIGRYSEALPGFFESSIKGHVLGRLYCGVMFKQMGRDDVANQHLQTLIREEKWFINVLKKLRQPKSLYAAKYWFCLGLYCEFVSNENSNPLLHPSKSLEYYEEGLARNEIQAIYHLAMLQKFKTTCFPLIEKAAKQGHEQAQVFMQLYPKSCLAPLDAKASLPLVDEAEILEITRLFVSFEIIDTGAQKLLEEVKKRLTLAAEEGHVRSQYLLAVLYYQLAKNILLNDKEVTNENYVLAMKYATQALKGNPSKGIPSHPAALDLIKCIKRDQPSILVSNLSAVVQALVGQYYSPGVFAGSAGASFTTPISSSTTSSSLPANGDSFSRLSLSPSGE